MKKVVPFDAQRGKNEKTIINYLKSQINVEWLN